LNLSSAKWLVGLACLWTALNCAKPLFIDDGAYHYYAAQIAQHPLDPYGFAVFWWSCPEPANEVLAPPLVPYWWSLAIRLFGEQPVLWKLWLFPFNLSFVFVVHALFRRFARGLEMPLVWLTVLSPTFLPSLNLMLDVPALALALAAVWLFLHACDRDSVTLAALSGLLAGCAMEAKYTSLLAPAAMLLFALTHGKLRLWPAAVVLAVQLFASWELLTALLYGRSHFLYAADNGVPLLERLLLKANLLLPLLGVLGGIAAPLALLGLAALRVPRGGIILTGILFLCGYLLVACLGVDFTARAHLEALPLAPDDVPVASFALDLIVFGIMGLVVAAVLLTAAGRLAPGVGRHVAWVARWSAYRSEIFLLLWLALEVAGYFALTPFPAVRRVMGLIIVGTLLVGHLAARTCRSPEGRRLVRCISAYGIALGLGFAALDLCEAWTEAQAAEAAAALVRGQGGSTWFVGHWGFQYYAERAGMRPVVTLYRAGARWYEPDGGPIPLPPPSQLRKGDWLVVPDARLTQQPMVLDERYLEPVYGLFFADPIPLQTVMCFYAGSTPLEHRSELTRLDITIYRVTADFEPVSKR
jgi:hypothetical protein